MTLPDYVASEVATQVYWSICNAVSDSIAKDTCNDIRNIVAAKVQEAIEMTHGEMQDQMTEDAVAERRGIT